MRTPYAIAALMLGAMPGLAAAEEAPAWSLHGFGEVAVQNDYVTPRGLVVTTAGATVQILNGLVLVSPGGVAFHAGTWTDINPGYSRADGNITAVNEFDFFFGVSGKIAPNLTAGVEYVQFISGQPSVAFKDERNIEFSLKYADAPDAKFSFNPYAKLFWAVDSKSSTVVLGKAGDTFDVELGSHLQGQGLHGQRADLDHGRPVKLLGHGRVQERPEFRRRLDRPEDQRPAFLHQGCRGRIGIRQGAILSSDQRQSRHRQIHSQQRRE
jgi:hypothetical protein